MAASGTTRVESADENRHIHVNAFEVLTDPYVMDSISFNNELVSQYPRTVTWVGSAALVPNAGTLAYGIYSFASPPTASNNTFLSKIPSINPFTLEAALVPATPTNVYFPRGGLWMIHAHFLYNTVQDAINWQVSNTIDFSTNAGVAWTSVSRNVTTQSAVLGPTNNSADCFFVHYFPTTGTLTDTRIRFTSASNTAMAAGISLTVRLVKLRN